MTLLWVLLVVVVAVVAWRARSAILAKILGQPQSRIDRHIGRKR